MSYLQKVSVNDQKDISRLIKRPQGVTIECVECCNGIIRDVDRQTFMEGQLEAACEFLFYMQQFNFASVSFDY